MDPDDTKFYADLRRKLAYYQAELSLKEVEAQDKYIDQLHADILKTERQSFRKIAELNRQLRETKQESRKREEELLLKNFELKCEIHRRIKESISLRKTILRHEEQNGVRQLNYYDDLEEKISKLQAQLLDSFEKSFSAEEMKMVRQFIENADQNIEKQFQNKLKGISMPSRMKEILQKREKEKQEQQKLLEQQQLSAASTNPEWMTFSFRKTIAEFRAMRLQTNLLSQSDGSQAVRESQSTEQSQNLLADTPQSPSKSVAIEESVTIPAKETLVNSKSKPDAGANFEVKHPGAKIDLTEESDAYLLSSNKPEQLTTTIEKVVDEAEEKPHFQIDDTPTDLQFKVPEVPLPLDQSIANTNESHDFQFGNLFNSSTSADNGNQPPANQGNFSFNFDSSATEGQSGNLPIISQNMNDFQFDFNPDNLNEDDAMQGFNIEGDKEGNKSTENSDFNFNFDNDNADTSFQFNF